MLDLVLGISFLCLCAIVICYVEYTKRARLRFNINDLVVYRGRVYRVFIVRPRRKDGSVVCDYGIELLLGGTKEMVCDSQLTLF